jgi:hypothetical protein
MEEPPDFRRNTERIMILGMSIENFTLLHVIISLIGIFSGFVVLIGMWQGRRPAKLTALFLITTILTSVTGFMFPSAEFGPPQVIGVLSLVLLAVALLALYGKHLIGSWRWIYVVTAVLSLYLNVFVGVVQAFQKVAFLHPLAPTGKEPPFAIAQGLVLVLFVLYVVLVLRRYRPVMAHQG